MSSAEASSDAVQAARLVDYEQTIGVVRQLTDVRFKLAAFVPTISAGAVALLSRDDREPLNQAMFGVGGFVFILGIVIYDLRNSQHYNSAIGRARALEAQLFQRLDGDSTAGLFGSRTDTNKAMEAQGRDHYLRIAVRHGEALSLVYTAAMAAWVWIISDALASGFMNATNHWNTGLGRWIHERSSWIVVVITTLAGCGIFWAHHRHDPPPTSTTAREVAGMPDGRS